MKKTEQVGASKLPPLLLAGGLLLLMIMMGSSGSLQAQDGIDPTPDPDVGTGVIITASQEDLDLLPRQMRSGIEKVSSFGAAGSYELSQSTVATNRDMALAGSTVTYTIVAMNSGDVDTPTLSVADSLPDGLTYLSHEFNTPDGGMQTGGGVSGNVVTWEGILGAGGSVEIVIEAQLDSNIDVGTLIKNTAKIAAGAKLAEPASVIAITDLNNIPNNYLPTIIYSEKPPTPDIVDIAASRPNAQNSWTVSWTGAGAVAFELQEAHKSNFSDAATINIGPEASKTFTYQPSPFNTYYYRVRSKAGQVSGNWSQTVKVIGGYRDEFTNPNTGWQLRRTSHLDNVNSWYEFIPHDIKWHILQVNDRWDLGLAAPLQEAPRIPYAIDLEVKSVHPGWQKGFGLVFAGDKVTENCPKDPNTVDGWYKHKDCFNEFYEFMLVEGADKKNLQVQRIHEVIWAGSGSGGIPVHRKVAKNWYIEKIPGISWDDYNRMRVVVRENQIEFYAGKRGGELKLQLVIHENFYPNNTYFGTIATTQEYSNVTARYEYFAALPIGN